MIKIIRQYCWTKFFVLRICGLPKVKKSRNCTNANIKIHFRLDDEISFSYRLSKQKLTEWSAWLKRERTINIYITKAKYRKVKLQTSRISNANLPSHILTRMQSPSVNCSLVGSPGSFKYISMKFCTELQNFTGSSIFKISW